jgi:hypothetical protein
MTRMIPLPLPDDLLPLLYTVSQGGRISLAMHACTLCGALVPDQGCGQHRRWHETVLNWITDLQERTGEERHD